MKTCILFLISIVSQLDAATVDIVSSFCVDELPAKFLNVKSQFNVRFVNPTDYFVKISPYDPDLKKIIVFDPFFNSEVIPKLPKDKLVLCVWEPVVLESKFYDTYSRVYTWDSSFVDNAKFFQFNYPYLMPIEPVLPRFEDKKLCTMVVGNWAEQRLNVLRFFEMNHPEGLECYGRCPPELKNMSMHKGHIPGQHSGKEKISILQNYRFCVCFENTIGLQGYITEKIFGCFAAGCIPIYWGASNITQYIPRDCFIDYRDFQNNEELYYFIKTMPKHVYEQYIERIRLFLKSKEAHLFSPAHFDEMLYEAVTS